MCKVLCTRPGLAKCPRWVKNMRISVFNANSNLSEKNSSLPLLTDPLYLQKKLPCFSLSLPPALLNTKRGQVSKNVLVRKKMFTWVSRNPSVQRKSQSGDRRWSPRGTLYIYWCNETTFPQLCSKVSINGILRCFYFGFCVFNHRGKGKDGSLANEDEMGSLNPQE